MKTYRMTGKEVFLTTTAICLYNIFKRREVISQEQKEYFGDLCGAHASIANMLKVELTDSLQAKIKELYNELDLVMVKLIATDNLSLQDEVIEEQKRMCEDAKDSSTR